jgi:hypothetical protein
MADSGCIDYSWPGTFVEDNLTSLNKTAIASGVPAGHTIAIVTGLPRSRNRFRFDGDRLEVFRRTLETLETEVDMIRLILPASRHTAGEAAGGTRFDQWRTSTSTTLSSSPPVCAPRSYKPGMIG